MTGLARASCIGEGSVLDCLGFVKRSGLCYDAPPMRNAGAARAPEGPATAAGLAAILFWGTSIAVNRLLMDSLGIVTGPMLLTLAAGGAGTVMVLLSPGQRAALRALPPRYWTVCGGLFLAYALAYNFGVGMAASRSQLLVFGILNYLWPVLTALFSTALQGRRIRPLMVLGAAAAFAGILVALLSRPGDPGQAPLSPGGILADLGAAPHVYVLGLFCGVSWALYSSLGRKLAGGSPARPVPVQFLAVGLVYLVIRLVVGPDGSTGPSWSFSSASILAYQALVANLLAYSLWDAAMRRGRQGLVAAASFFTPLLSSACVGLLLGIRPEWRFWTACLLVVAGAVLCRLGEAGAPPPRPERPRAPVSRTPVSRAP